jgi:hypothetical protein
MAYESDVFPWLRHLSEEGQRQFFEEILQISVLSHELGTPIPEYVERLNVCVAGWKATAEAFNKEGSVEAERPEVPRSVRAPQKLCTSNVPDPNRDDSAHWCNLSVGHTGVHRSRHGHTWTDTDARRARSLDEFPGPRHGE